VKLHSTMSLIVAGIVARHTSQNVKRRIEEVWPKNTSGRDSFARSKDALNEVAAKYLWQVAIFCTSTKCSPCIAVALSLLPSCPCKYNKGSRAHVD
jgi:hypothetical protein